MRVTGGRYRGRKLRVPRAGARPTADRVREALFARLGELDGLAVLDLFAGSGALGIEALSRGAQSVVFVERAARSLEALNANLEQLELAMVTRVLRADVCGALERLGAEEHFDLVLMDPPYASKEIPEVLETLVAADVLGARATVIVEHSRRQTLPAVAGLVALDERRYGETVIARLGVAGRKDSE